MPTLADGFRSQNDRRKRAVAKTTGTFTVVTVDPEFTVTLDGSITAVPALKVTGLTYVAGDTGTYSLRQGQKPVCTITV